ncbi:MAG: TRAP transporter small permease [Geminicoccaceae bacterium]|nr:TRAP transporter small permease [Geminicoccaceae bacterium]
MFKKYAFEACIASVLFIVLFFVILIQIFGRTPLFVGPVWTEEAARWLWVWMAFIGIAAVERDQAHLRMGFLTARLPAPAQRGLAIFFDVAWLALVCHLNWIAWGSIGRTWNNEAVSLPVTDALLYAAAFVGLILIALRILRRLIDGHRDTRSEAEVRL